MRHWRGPYFGSKRAGDNASVASLRPARRTNIIRVQPSFWLPARTLAFNASSGHLPDRTAHWRSQLNIDNLLDKDYLQSSHGSHECLGWHAAQREAHGDLSLLNHGGRPPSRIDQQNESEWHCEQALRASALPFLPPGGASLPADFCLFSSSFLHSLIPSTGQPADMPDLVPPISLTLPPPLTAFLFE